mmetsp:Transcript_3867/g.7917  ORF Transcript_3867/g.7917 Transcript_3867/m.7917 type:complete len:347 (+) Transcript_3867:64-1104(+)|eukprot:CAMPEP_0168728114 /NCGR_PEP_ID=MMETSP0724-20121128/5518_1 /TAXON_ID=265536 /ORGANISM="Amphiprora sp., Strain CCMP467" /LENGTH=346 /DNA_ID=CAMNT_0008774951 /DNA_START=60 /DNA_END=1100 /DNA_ORIENTATION=+
MSKLGWGDADDSDEEENQQEVLAATSDKPQQGTGGVTVPPTHYSRVDKQGIQIVTSYKPGRSAGQLLIKTVTKQRVERYTVKEPKGVQERRTWKKFGTALEDEKAGVQTTVQSKDEVLMENPNADTDLQDEDPAKAISANLNDFWAKQHRRQLARKYDVSEDVDATGEAKSDDAGDGWTQVRAAGGAGGAAGGAAPGRYVPPSMRGGAAPAGPGAAYKAPGRGGSTMDDLNTIRVTNLSENTTEADLQELFSHFGRVSRVYLAKNKETMESRGFAFVTFVNQKDAAAAMEKLQGFGYDHLILKLEWARPNTPKDPATSGNEYRSGYGKALAQDTKEKVSFASNLTK